MNRILGHCMSRVAAMALLGALAATPACAPGPAFVAVPEPVADTSDGAISFYTRVQRDIETALSAEFPDTHFEQLYARTTSLCPLSDGTYGRIVHLPIYGSRPPVPADSLEHAADVFEKVASRAGFHGRQVMPPDTGFAIRMFAADGSYVTFGSYVASTVSITVGCYRN